VPDSSPQDLRADCARCSGLCCVAPAFAASADFAMTKPAGQPCPNLGADFRCAIHDRLRPSGFPGCTVYDCFGAGQQVTQVTFGGADWRSGRATADRVFAAFAVMRELHELLWHLAEALTLDPARELHPGLRAAATEITALTRLGADELIALDTGPPWRDANELLLRASERTRMAARHDPPDHRGASLVGASLAGADLRAASLRGARLVGTDLRHADLRLADITGADLRGSDLGGATLTGALFLTQAQLDAARGDATTLLPDRRTRPGHWTAGRAVPLPNPGRRPGATSGPSGRGRGRRG
jgi:uncharacterized protein YjbI with pentapeptide repeats